MQPTPRPFQMVQRVREISFSSLDNFNSKTESRSQSPSIAVESVLQLTIKNEENMTQLHSAHKRYINRNTSKGSNEGNHLMVTNDQSMKENQANNHYNSRKDALLQAKFQCKSQRSEQKCKQWLQQYFSNTSPIKDEQIHTSAPKLQASLSAFKCSFTTDEYSQEQSFDNSSFQDFSFKPSTLLPDSIQTEIAKLHVRIQKLQKVRLQTIKISKDSDVSSIKKYASNHRKQMTLSTEDQQDIQSARFSQQSSESMIKSRIVTFRQAVNQEDIKTPRLLDRNLNKSKKKLTKTGLEMVKSQPQRLDNQKNVLKNIQNIIKYPQSTVKIENNEVRQKGQAKQFLRHIESQIKLDQSLRKAKKWFQKWHNLRKWEQLKIQVKTKVIQIKDQQIKNMFSIGSEEQNPFYSPKNDDFNLVQLCQFYLKAQKHWTRNILGQFSAEQLQKDSFRQENLDICKNGSIGIEDLVRFINFQLDSTYRNRDIFLIFRRLSNGKTLHFSDLLQCLSNNSS